MLEDDFTYVTRKALKGCGLTLANAARQAGLAELEIVAFSQGKFSASTARRLAPVLGLNPEALAKHDRYLPKPQTLPSIHRLDLAFGADRVNAWLIWTDDALILFDTGYLASSCQAALAALGTALPDSIFITHAHPDHTGGVPSLLAQGNRPYGCNLENAQPMNPGDTRCCGSLRIHACDLSGHANPALGFQIEGLPCPVLITGDALFAGSIGGCATPALYRHALLRLKAVLSPLPDSTLLLPGHGPATTLGEERQSNPFL